MTTAAVLSFRFGPTDGVSVVARSWIGILREIGFDVLTVAGEGDAHRIVEGLGIEASSPPDPDDLHEALADVDLVVVENLLTIPLNLPASRAVAAELAGRPALLHHHDPPWHRDRWAHVTELPAGNPAWRHVAITSTAAVELRDRCGIDATVIPNGFAPPGAGDRAGQRARLGVEDHEVLLAHPVRAIERKGVPTAVALAEAMDATYWLLGPAEEDYAETLEAVLERARCRVIRQPCSNTADIYAASDAVAYPSTWEGFGNPPIEAALHRRPAAVGHYPVAEELRTMGFGFVEPDDPDRLLHLVHAPDQRLLDTNERLARTHFSIDAVREGLVTVLERAGWCP